jgi:hypothetical protein
MLAGHALESHDIFKLNGRRECILLNTGETSPGQSGQTDSDALSRRLLRMRFRRLFLPILPPHVLRRLNVHSHNQLDSVRGQPSTLDHWNKF